MQTHKPPTAKRIRSITALGAMLITSLSVSAQPTSAPHDPEAVDAVPIAVISVPHLEIDQESWLRDLSVMQSALLAETHAADTSGNILVFVMPQSSLPGTILDVSNSIISAQTSWRTIHFSRYDLFNPSLDPSLLNNLIGNAAEASLLIGEITGPHGTRFAIAQ